MKAGAAAELVRFLEENGVEVYVDGGWAVDALIGQQTRMHGDLDIALPEKHVPRLRELLLARGYEEQSQKVSWECNFVLADAQGHEVDVHSYTLDDAGNNIHGVPYMAEQLTGRGVIDGYPVNCISAEWLVKFHTEYEPDESDFHDVRQLSERFGISLPDCYVEFARKAISRRTEQWLSGFVAWSSSQLDIHGVALVGSHAANCASEDSDIDLVVLTAQPARYIRDTEWVRRFGEVHRQQVEEYGKVTSLRVWYSNGPEVEFGFADKYWTARPLDEGTHRVISSGMRVLFERGSILSELKA